MAVLSVTETFDRSGEFNQLWQRVYERNFRVTCSDVRDGPVVIQRAAGLPRVGNSYFVSATERDTGSFVQTVTPKCEGQLVTADGGVIGASWIVTVKYGPYDANTFSGNPVDWPAKWSWSAQKYERAVSKDVSGNSILNSAGEKFADPVTVDDSRPVLTVVRNELVSAFDPLMAMNLRDKVNAALWNGADPKTVKVDSITTSDPQFSQDYGWFFAVTYVFSFDRNTWTKFLLDQGYTDISVLDSTKRLTIRGQDGQPLSDPSLLNGSGHRLAVGGTPQYIPYEVYETTDFGVFNLEFTQALGY